MLPATVRVFVWPGLMLKLSPTTAWWLELSVLELPSWVPVSSIRTRPENTASDARPTRWTVTPVIVTTAPELLVSVNAVNGTRAALSGASEFAGCTAGATVTPGPVGVGVVGVVGVVGAAQRLLAFAREIGPQ